MTPPYRVLIVDDSSIIRSLLTKIIGSSPLFEVVGTAPDPYVARDKIAELNPHVLTLDIEMPKMDGVTFLEKLMVHHPMRVLVISSLSQRGSELALRAFEAGAVDVMAKPAIDVQHSLQEMGDTLLQKLKAVAMARLPTPTVKRAPSPLLKPLERTTHQILAIGSSTGGTEALRAILPLFPHDAPGTVIVQHMPPVFTAAFANSLQKICKCEVKEAQNGDRVQPGRILLAPGNFHMELTRNGAFYEVRLHQEPHLHGVRPAADFLFHSTAKVAGKNSVGVVLTGMGKDGAAGLLAMRQGGAYTIAQDENSCVVFGMPKEAIALGGVCKILPLDKIAGEIMRVVNERTEDLKTDKRRAVG